MNGLASEGGVIANLSAGAERILAQLPDWFGVLQHSFFHYVGIVPGAIVMVAFALRWLALRHEDGSIRMGGPRSITYRPKKRDDPAVPPRD
ncbi:MAG: hypothetical protein K2Q06_04660 [Parvularculaceae bacterium]|nr:hypothetical protein [Parvularculaceae bacterium]